MNVPFSQQSRMGRLATDLGRDALVLMRFEGMERLNALFDFRVDCLGASDSLDFDALIGTHATVRLDNHQSQRRFDGIVTEVRWLGAGENGPRYQLRLQPWFWLASLRRNQRIFHNKTVVQILEELLAAYSGAGKLRVETTADYPALEYTVQFRESDMDFACRMMERHGISYHFQHVDGGHDMVLTDFASAHPAIGSRDFHPDEGHHQADEEHFWLWRPARRITTGAVRLTDYNFKTPTAAMEVDRTGDAAHAQGQIESFDWPGDYLDQGRGRVMAQLRAEAERGQDKRFEAEGDVLSLGAGGRVTLAGDPVMGSGAQYLCLVATHSYTSDNYGSGGQLGDDLAYRGRYVLMPETAPMLPERKTARADVRGPQTAVVVGEGEIDCDEFGRILVKFHWDLASAHSMRCRVSQSWAGDGWGGMVIPRIGMQVVVEFLDGDPDQPLVTGCVYNGRNKVPYDLPAHKTRSTFKTKTHKGGGFNELRFEDEKGKEEIFVHAEKDMNIEVQNDRSKRVERHQHEIIGADKSIEVGGDHDETIAGNLSIAVGKNPLSQTIMSKTRLLFSKAGGIMEKMKIPDPFNFAKGNMQMFIEKNKSEIVNIASSEIVGVSKSTIVGHSFQQSIGKAMSLIVRGRYDTDVGKVMNIRVGDQLTIKVGENSMMTMSKEGKIVIKGKKIVLDADQIDMN